MQGNAIAAIPEFAAIVNGTDSIHVKSVDCRISLREFLSAVLSYMPGWMRFLYRVRWVFVRLLGASQDGVPQAMFVAPDNVAFAKGGEASIFTVVEAKEGSYWLGKATDKMITGYLGVIAEPLGNGANRFHIVTAAKFNHWTGPIYFTVIKPFHHLVVVCMAREAAAVRASIPENAALARGGKA
ncbi:DUF2867 domain-containing protein [Solidesulfovibrio sp.]